MRKLIAILLLSALPSLASIARTMQWDVRTTGSDSNSGGFDPGVASPGTDYSQQNSPQYSFTDLVIGATTTQFTSVLHPVGNTFPGNTVKITGGSGCTTGVYDILSNATTTATVDRAMGTAASVCTGVLGGSLASMCSSYSGGCQAGAFSWLSTATGGYNTIWVKAGTYTCSTNLVSNSCYQNTNALNVVASVTIHGYSSTHGDLPTNPINLSANPLFTTSTANLQIFNEDGNYVLNSINMSNTTTVGLPYAYALLANVNSGHLFIFACRFDISGTTAGEGIYQQFSYGTTIWASEFIGNSTGACTADLGGENQRAALWIGLGTYIHGCGEGVWDYNNNGNQPWYISDSVFANNGRHLYQQAGGELISIHGSAFYNATNEAVNANPQNDPDFVLNVENSIFYGGTVALSLVNAANPAYANNAYGNFSTQNWVNAAPVLQAVPDITLTAIPWVSASTGNFALNNSAGGGALLQALGFPGSAPAGTSTQNVGPIQTQGSSGGGAAPHAISQ